MKADIVVDIETVVEPVTPDDVKEYMAEWEAPSNYKDPAAILRHREKFEREAIDKLLNERRFSIGGKRMISAALGLISAGKVVDIQSWAGDDLSVITKGLVGYLDGFPEYRLIGWNHKRFDLPEITKSYHITGVAPKRRPAKWDIIDLADHPFSKTKLKDCAKAFRIPQSGTNGADVQQMYEEGRWDEIQKYNEEDVSITGTLFVAASRVFTF